MSPLIGMGAYGCVFKPYVKCSSKIKKINNGIGKIFMDNSEFYNEKLIYEKIQLLDPNNEFTLPLYTSCSVQDFTKKDQIEKCTLLESSENKQYNQLIYKFGGKDIKSIIQFKGNFNKFMNIFIKLRPIFLGIQKLHQNNLVHQDIKPANILFDNDKLYLIDFGIVIKTDKIYKKENTYVLKYNYPYYPPEYKLYINKGSFNSFYIKILNNFNFDFYIGTKYINLLSVIKNNIGINIKEELINIFNYRKDIFQTSKIDLYSLGIIILELYIWSNLYNKHFKRNTKIKQIQTKINELIKGMIRFDSRLRDDIPTSIIIYDDIIKIWNKN